MSQLGPSCAPLEALAATLQWWPGRADARATARCGAAAQCARAGAMGATYCAHRHACQSAHPCKASRPELSMRSRNVGLARAGSTDHDRLALRRTLRKACSAAVSQALGHAHGHGSREARHARARPTACATAHPLYFAAVQRKSTHLHLAWRPGGQGSGTHGCGRGLHKELASDEPAVWRCWHSYLDYLDECTVVPPIACT